MKTKIVLALLLGILLALKFNGYNNVEDALNDAEHYSRFDFLD